MKQKAFTRSLTMILFVISIIEFFMLLVNINVPSIAVMISTLLLFTIATLEAVKTQEFKKLLYPLIAVYFLLVIPIIEKLIYNNILFIAIVIASFIITMMFLYNNLLKSNKEKF
ncbi:hypothetical protein [Clostridium taeniosporum]|uniref:Uncharacterized protein n=1 Tax=Clostridium taeniosporum TaxID=394958 RepID=A0A1D7XPK6_9CLOT|nr:hypothetical protein [Clostridium taeniosporum]AOR25119.1 hypothetical protein BGI42_15360 [Clostridium taeniosporum]